MVSNETSEGIIDCSLLAMLSFFCCLMISLLSFSVVDYLGIATMTDAIFATCCWISGIITTVLIALFLIIDNS